MEKCQVPWGVDFFWRTLYTNMGWPGDSSHRGQGR